MADNIDNDLKIMLSSKLWKRDVLMVGLLLSILYCLASYYVSSVKTDWLPCTLPSQSLPMPFQRHESPHRCEPDARQTHLLRYCTNNKNHVQRPFPVAYNNYIMMKSRDVFYCQIAKVSSTMWKALMFNSAAGTTNISEINVAEHLRQYNRRGLRQHGIVVASEYRPEYNLHTKMIVVRHPFTRVLSAYHNIRTILSKNPGSPFLPGPSTEVVSDITSNLSNAFDLPLTRFIAYITANTSTHYDDKHWKPMVEMCDVCAINFTHILRLETLGTDSALILKLLGYSDTKLPTLHSSQQHNNHTSLEKFEEKLSEFQNVSKDLMKALRERYQDDLKAFGYFFDIDKSLASCQIDNADLQYECC